MTTLALDASFRTVTAALLDDQGKLLHALHETSEAAKSLTLPGVLDRLWQVTQTEPSLMRRLVFAVGPGGFTSLRVAWSTLMGIFWGQELEVYPVSSLQLRLLGLDNPGALPAIWLQRAGTDYYYVGWRQLALLSNGEALFSAQDLSPWLSQLGDYLVAGEAVSSLGSAFFARGKVVTQNDLWSASAFSKILTESQKIADMTHLNLNYLRPPV